MKKVIHLIPFDGIGGVEVAALSMQKTKTEELSFEVKVIFPLRKNKGIFAYYNPIKILSVFKEVWNKSPDILIVSLWRAYIVGAMYKLFNRKSRLVVFLHAEKHAHFVDKIVTMAALKSCDEIWADSDATINALIAPGGTQDRFTVSYIPMKLAPVTDQVPKPTFIFWGRLAKQKNVNRALCIFEELSRDQPKARFIVIGPDGGEEKNLRKAALERGLERRVFFLGPLSHSELPRHAREASFFLLTSDYEGMGLSVVEAMQLGLVPVVTPVGAIREYCRDGVNAIIVRNDHDTVNSIVEALDNVLKYEELRRQAILAWKEAETYQDSVIKRCRYLLNKR